MASNQMHILPTVKSTRKELLPSTRCITIDPRLQARSASSQQVSASNSEDVSHADRVRQRRILDFGRTSSGNYSGYSEKRLTIQEEPDLRAGQLCSRSVASSSLRGPSLIENQSKERREHTSESKQSLIVAADNTEDVRASPKIEQIAPQPRNGQRITSRRSTSKSYNTSTSLQTDQEASYRPSSESQMVSDAILSLNGSDSEYERPNNYDTSISLFQPTTGRSRQSSVASISRRCHSDRSVLTPPGWRIPSPVLAKEQAASVDLAPLEHATQWREENRKINQSPSLDQTELRAVSPVAPCSSPQEVRTRSNQPSTAELSESLIPMRADATPDPIRQPLRRSSRRPDLKQDKRGQIDTCVPHVGLVELAVAAEDGTLLTIGAPVVSDDVQVPILQSCSGSTVSSQAKHGLEDAQDTRLRSMVNDAKDETLPHQGSPISLRGANNQVLRGCAGDADHVRCLSSDLVVTEGVSGRPSGKEDGQKFDHGEISPRKVVPTSPGGFLCSTTGRDRFDDIFSEQISPIEISPVLWATSMQCKSGMQRGADRILRMRASKQKSVSFDAPPFPPPLPPFVIWVGKLPGSWVQIFEHQYDGARYDEIAAPSEEKLSPKTNPSTADAVEVGVVEKRGKDSWHSAEEVLPSVDDEAVHQPSRNWLKCLSWLGVETNPAKQPPDLLELPLAARNQVFNYLVAANPLDLCIWINRTVLSPDQEMYRKNYHISTGSAGNLLGDFELLRSITKTVGNCRVWQFHVKNLRCFDCIGDIVDERKKSALSRLWTKAKAKVHGHYTCSDSHYNFHCWHNTPLKRFFHELGRADAKQINYVRLETMNPLRPIREQRIKPESVASAVYELKRHVPNLKGAEIIFHPEAMATRDPLYNKRMVCAMISLQKALPKGQNLRVRGLHHSDPLILLWMRERRHFCWRKGRHYRRIGRLEDSLCMPGSID